MLPNAFIGKSTQPTEKELASELGPTKALWDQLLADLADQLDTPIQEWHSYSVKAGWSLKVKRGSRTILYLGPCHGAFRVAFVLGDKPVKAALQSRLPASLLKMIREAKRYPEGTAVRIEVKTAKDLAPIKTLAALKLEH